MQPTDTQPLIAVTRGNTVEMIHRGAYVIVSRENKIIHSVGNPSMPTYLRSAAKPFQMQPLIERGGHETFGLTAPEIAVIGGSHNGEPIHVETARSVLKKANVPESALQCGPHMPGEQETAYMMIRRNVVPTAIHSNCSGKHSGMLAAAKAGGEPLDTYLDYDSRLQQDILHRLADLSGVNANDIPMERDGCGAPAHVLPLENVAWLYAQLGEPRDNAALRVTRDAMMAAPYLASGKGRLDVKLMETFPNRLVCKSGALGVFGIGLPDLGIGIALKIESGDGTAQKATALQALKQAMGDHMEDGVFEELWSELIPPITNLRGVVVGEVRWTQDMTRI